MSFNLHRYTKAVRIVSLILLVIICTTLIIVPVAAQDTVIELAPQIIDTTDILLGTYFNQTVIVPFTIGETAQLSGITSLPIFVVDAIRITVTHQDGSNAVYYFEQAGYSLTTSVPAFDFTPYLEVGNNTIFIELINLYLAPPPTLTVYGGNGVALHITPPPSGPPGSPPPPAPFEATPAPVVAPIPSPDEQGNGVTRPFDDGVIVAQLPSGQFQYYLPDGCLIGLTEPETFANANLSERYIIESLEGCNGYRIDVWSLGYPACQIQVNFYGPDGFERVYQRERQVDDPSCVENTESGTEGDSPTNPTPLNPCPPGTGPGGLPPGNYPPDRLTREQHQWLWEVFGHGDEGDVPVGYGGEPCGNSRGHDWLDFVCSAGHVGPDGITPGSYNVDTLTREQHRWLWEIFGHGHEGAVPVGYGGEDCSSSPSPGSRTTQPPRSLPVCPGGYGPGGIVAGSYLPQDLTQDQRQWLWELFGHGHEGVAPVGYGGEECIGNPEPPQPPSQTEPINNNWGTSNTVHLCLGTQIRVGSGLQYSVQTVVPVNNWPVTVIGGPRYGDGYTWWDISRADGGSGWVREDQANCRPGGGSNQTAPSGPQQPIPVDLGTDVPRIEPTTSLNIRSCPSINCSTVGSIQPGTGYEVIGKNRNALWLQIAQGWVCRNYTRDNGLLFLAPFTSEMTENCSGEDTETEPPIIEPVQPVEQPSEEIPCSDGGCIRREAGDNERLFASHWVSGICPRDDEGDTDWIVTYRTNNHAAWQNVSPLRIRFYARPWSLYRYYESSARINIIDGDYPDIVLCLGGGDIEFPEPLNSLIFGILIRGTWIWLQDE